MITTELALATLPLWPATWHRRAVLFGVIAMAAMVLLSTWTLLSVMAAPAALLLATL